MKILQQDTLDNEMAEKIGAAINKTNGLVTPKAETGEIIMAFSTAIGKWHVFFHATLDGGAGDSCAMAKLQTMINHPEYNWGGIIPLEELGPDEKKWYGSVRLINCRDLEQVDGWQGQIIITFSDRKEWQDVLYIAAILKDLESVIKMSFDLPPDIMNDPVWGTALNIAKLIA